MTWELRDEASCDPQIQVKSDRVDRNVVAKKQENRRTR